jgi:hypothetical protein
LSIAKPGNANLIDTLGSGYRVLHRRLWVVAIPAALSAYLWLAAPITLAPVASELRLALEDLARAFGGDEATREQWARQILAGDVRVALAWLNFVPLLAPGPGHSAANAVRLQGALQLLGAAALINLLALLLSSLYLTVLAEAVRGDLARPLDSLRRAGRVAMDIVLYLLALAGLGLIMALPFLAISAILIVALPASTLLILLAWYVALFWAYVYTGFAPEAITLSRAGPLRAIYNSVHIVRRNLGPTLGLLLLTFVIVNGLGLIWRRLAATPPGLAVAILGSAYVGSGLAAARLVFYRERLARWAGAGAR